MKFYPAEEDVKVCVDLLINRYGITTTFLNDMYGREKRSHVQEMISTINTLEFDGTRTLCKLIVLEEGASLFSGVEKRTLRKKILAGMSEEQIATLYQRHCKNGNCKTKGYMITELNEKHWVAGKTWASDFIQSAGFPPIFAGISQERSEAKKSLEVISPRNPVPSLVDYQIDMKNKLLEVLNADVDNTRCMISLPTGGGKTRVAVDGFLDWMQERFNEQRYLLWIAQSEELCEQCISCIEQLWTDREFILPLRVHRYFAKYGDNDDSDSWQGGVVVSSITKIHNGLKKNGNFINHVLTNTGAMIIDEAHRAASYMYDNMFEAAESLTNGRLFPVCGLSATPGRNTAINFNTQQVEKLVNRFESTLIVPKFSHSVEYAENPIKYFKDECYLSKIYYYKVDSGIEIELSEEEVEKLSANTTLNEFSGDTLKELARNTKRNSVIINRLLKVSRKEPTLIYCCTVEHARFISSILNLHGRTSAFIDSDTNITERRLIIKAFKDSKINFLCNYGVLTTGFDAPKTKNIVICRPVNSDILYEQIIGRGIRGEKFGGTALCNVIDFSDNISKHGIQQASERFKHFWDNK